MIFHDPERLMTGYVTALYGPPAFVRRERAVQAAWQAVVDRCRADRAMMLRGVRVALLLAEQALGSESQHNGDVAVRLDELQVKWRVAAVPRRARNALRGVADSVRRFNRRWGAHVNQIDLSEVNRLRDGYNRYYVLEKECALRSERLARLGFQPLPPVTATDLLAEFPELSVPTPVRDQWRNT